MSTRYRLYPLEGFSLNFGQMFASVKWCAEPIAQPCRLTRLQLKVTGLILSEMMCRTHNSTMQTHSWRPPVWALNFEAAPLSFCGGGYRCPSDCLVKFHFVKKTGFRLSLLMFLLYSFNISYLILCMTYNMLAHFVIRLLKKNIKDINSTNGAMILEMTYRRKVPFHWLADSSSDWH